MDQIKIGKFIATRRKENNLTQIQLAKKLNITDRAVSKWENGKAMPDSSIMLELCRELKINVNELLSGEVLRMDNYNENAEQNLLELKKQKEQADKKLLVWEIILGVSTIILYTFIILLVSFIQMEDNNRVLIVSVLTCFLTIVCCFLLRIEQLAGYYECQKCQYRYVPTYFNVLLAPHINRTRYMKCPKCNERSWQKKVIGKD